MDTQQIMRTALKLAGFSSIPADSEVHVEGKNVRKALVAIDVGVAEILLARELGCDAVIAHHPAGGRAKLEGYKVFERHVGQLYSVLLRPVNRSLAEVIRARSRLSPFNC